MLTPLLGALHDAQLVPLVQLLIPGKTPGGGILEHFEDLEQQEARAAFPPPVSHPLPEASL